MSITQSCDPSIWNVIAFQWIRVDMSKLSVWKKQLRAFYKLINCILFILRTDFLFCHNNLFGVVIFHIVCSTFYFDGDAYMAPSQYKDGLSRYVDFHYKDKTVMKPSYLYDGSPKMVRRHPCIETDVGSNKGIFAPHRGLQWCVNLSHGLKANIVFPVKRR